MARGTKTFSKLIFLAGASGAALISASAAAQTATGGTEVENNQEIIVTATKRDSTVQDVPFSINAQTEADIQRSGAVTIEDLSRNVAGLSVQNLGPGQSQVSVRGVSAGQIARDQPGVKEQVGVYLDESVISLSLFTPDIDLFDLNRVETLRGPQGTLFGSGSVGGTIRYITNQPNPDRFEAQAEGNVNLVDGDDFGAHLKGAVNVPFPGGAVRAVAYTTTYGGFIDALREGGSIEEDINGGRREGGRISVLFQPTEQISITPRVLYQEVHAEGFNRQEVFNLLANPFTRADVPGGRAPVVLRERQQFLLRDESFNDEVFLADLTAEIDFGGAALTSVTSYIDRELLIRRDASALTGSISISFGFPAAAVLLPSELRDTTDLKTFTQELRVASTGSGPFQWLVGGFYSDVEREYGQFLPTPGYDAVIDAAGRPGDAARAAGPFPANSPFNSVVPFDIRQTALFGEASYKFGPLTATAGLRYFDFKEERSLLFQGLFTGLSEVEQETSSDGFTPRFLLSYEATPEITVNAQVAKGFRLGGVNDPLNLPICTPADRDLFGPFAGAYDDETLWNYEAGLKSQFGGITFNAAAFYTDIKNLQVTLDAGSCSSRIVFNVEEAHTQGVEFEFSAEPVDNLDFSIAGSYVEAEFDSTVLSGGDVVGGIREGNRLAGVPKFQIAGSATYTVPLGDDGAEGFLSASVQHVGSRYTQPSDQENNPRSFVSALPFGGATGTAATVVDLKLPSYELVNISAGVELANRLEVTAYITNLLDENPLLSFDRERGGRARLGFSVGNPRTYGVTVRKRF